MVDVIVPCYNESDILKEFYKKTTEELKNIKHILIFINDGSNDNTLKELKEIYNKDKEHVRIISFSRNFGKEAALLAGLSSSKGDYAAIIDADLQQNPKYLVKMYNFLENNKDYDSICMCQKQEKNRFVQNVFYKIMDSLSEVHIENGASDFRMFRKSVVKSILSLSEKSRFTKGIFSYIGFNTYYDEYIVEKRTTGTSKWSTFKLLQYAKTGIVGFSSKPLAFVNYLGIASIIVAFLELIVNLCLKRISEYTILIMVILLMSGILLLGMGIVGEYIGKIYIETKNRPVFIAKERIGFDEEIL